VANVLQDDGVELAILLEDAASRSRTLRHVDDALLLDLYIFHGGVMNIPGVDRMLERAISKDNSFK
jgi:hypothetical protein